MATVGLILKLGYFLFQDLLLSTWELEYLKDTQKGLYLKQEKDFWHTGCYF